MNYPLWPEPKSRPRSASQRQATAGPLQCQGPWTVPKPEGAYSNIGHEHLAMLLRANPQMVSFHFRLAEQEVLDAIKGAVSFVISSATTVAEAKMLEQRGWMP